MLLIAPLSLCPFPYLPSSCLSMADWLCWAGRYSGVTGPSCAVRPFWPPRHAKLCLWSAPLPALTLKMAIISILITFLVAVTKYLRRSDWKEEDLFGSQFEGLQSTMKGRHEGRQLHGGRECLGLLILLYLGRTGSRKWARSGTGF